MRLSLRAISVASTMAVLLAAAPIAHADSVAYGSVWEGATSYPNSLTAPAPSGTPTATFTVANPGGNDFNFAGTTNGSPSYTLGGFLASGGDIVHFLTGSTKSGDSINNDIFEFKGETILKPGTYTITHDDGMILFINGVKVINAGAPTSASASSFVWSGTGAVSFDLLYAEVNGAPAVLSGNLGSITTTPEPSSFVLLGSGLLAAAGMVRRRMMA